MTRRLLLAAMAALLAVQIVRNSLVAEFAVTSPDIASHVWPGHPRSEIALGMAQIAQSARERAR